MIMQIQIIVIIFFWGKENVVVIINPCSIRHQQSVKVDVVVILDNFNKVLPTTFSWGMSSASDFPIKITNSHVYFHKKDMVMMHAPKYTKHHRKIVGISMTSFHI